MEELIKMLEEVDTKLKERISSMQSQSYFLERQKLAQVRTKIQEAINGLLLMY